MRPHEVDGARSMLESMAKDLAASFPQGMKRAASQQNASEANAQAGAARLAQPQQSQQPQPAPLNAANLEKQNQALKMHQRSASKSGQVPPPAPTTATAAQPPFSFGAPSPAGQPTYLGKNTITQSDLTLPARKRPKTGTHSGPGSTNQSANASPQVPKQPSPEMVKRAAPPETKAPPKPQFLCPELGCEANNIGFLTEEARRIHHEEEHIKPRQDPIKFAGDNLAAALGLDPEGHAVAPPKSQAAGQSPAPQMTKDSSKQGQTPVGRNDATPMSRESSTKRQAGSTGPKTSDLMKNLNANLMAGSSSTAKALDGTAGTVRGDITQLPVADDLWAATTIDPQTLFQNIGLPESGGNGAISDMNVYRAITPNDTPESSKDGSEPNSDVSEGVTLNVTLDMGFDTWRPFEGDQALDFGPIEPNFLDVNDQINLSESAFAELTSWDDANAGIDFGKPFSLDTSLYSLDTTG